MNVAASRRRWRRVIAIVLVALALSPGLFWRSPPIATGDPTSLTVTPLDISEGAQIAPGLAIGGGWRLQSATTDFGGYSALLLLGGHALLALSDRGHFLRFAQPDAEPDGIAAGPVAGADDSDKRLHDIESATRDPRSGTIWLGYEGTNAIHRFDAHLRPEGAVRPPEMQGWPSNRGPEAMVRLVDGRFVVLSEALSGGERPFSEGLLFASDPLGGARPETFRFVPPEGFRPTDMAQLPDGRVVVLLRKLVLALPPGFVSQLVVADPATIGAGEEWSWRPLAQIRDPLPPENYEGLAIEPRANGAVRLWLISDDNQAAFQRTLLLALDWRAPSKGGNGPNKKARGGAARPSKPID